MLREWPAFEALAKSFAEGEVRLRVAGLTGSARALAVAELLQAHPRPALVVVAGLAEAHRWTQDLKLFGATALEFPPPEPRLWRGGHHREADAERAVIARRLAAGEPVIVVATPAGLDTPLPAPRQFADRSLRITAGDRLERELLLEAFETAGYERVDTVEEVPRFSGRFADLTVALARWRVEGFTVRLVVADELQAEHLRQILRDHDVEALIAPGIDAPEPLAIVVGELSAGLAIAAVGLILLTETEI